MARVGTLDWAHVTGGRLRRRDRVALVIQAGPLLTDLIRGWVAGSSSGGSAGLDRRATERGGVDGPGTPIALAALEMCSRVSPEWLVAHSRRTYAYAPLFARDRPFDPERLFVACMLHDIGLTDAFKRGSDPGLVEGYGWPHSSCFAVRGAEVAHRLAASHGWHSSERDRLAEVISLHLNVFARSRRGIEVELLSAASAFDVIRLRSRRVDPECVQAVEARWPRDETFCDGLRAAWRRESDTGPGSRAAFLDPWGLFDRLIARNCRALGSTPGNGEGVTP
jgi:hypothetical protein